MRAARLASALVLTAALAFETPTARACAYDNEAQDFSLDTLDHYVPGAFEVVLRQVDARRDGSLTRLIDPNTPKLFAYQRLVRVLKSFETQLRAAAQASNKPPPAVAILLVESMLWVRLPADIAQRPAEIHASGPQPGDIIAVLADDAMGAVVNATLDLDAAAQRGLLKLLHTSEEQARDFNRVYASVGRSTAPGVR